MHLVSRCVTRYRKNIQKFSKTSNDARCKEWAEKKTQEMNLGVAGMRMLGYMFGVTSWIEQGMESLEPLEGHGKLERYPNALLQEITLK